MESNTLFAERLKELRKERNLTQVKFAEQFNVSSGAVGMWETGKREPDFETVSRLAQFFHVSIDYLVGNVNNPFFHVDNERVVREINSLEYEDEDFITPEEREKIKRKSLLPEGAELLDLSKFHRIPVLGRITAGLPIYAEENIEGYTLTDLNHGGEYFALRVRGDSMNAAQIMDGGLVIVRRQEEVENGEVAVVMVDRENATVKRFYRTETTVTLMPQSTNPDHRPQVYDLAHTQITVLGKVIKAEIVIQ